MERDGLRAGHLMALAGAAVLLVALWLPWFELHLGPLARTRLSQGAAQLGGASLAAYADGLFAQLDGVRVSAWTAFGGEDVALAAGAALVALAVLVAGGAGGPGVRVDRAAAARIALGGGLVLTAIVVVRLLDRPAPHELLGVAPGAYVGLLGSLMIAVGGALASRAPAPRPTGMTPAAGARDAWASPSSPSRAATSVAPPPR